MRILQMRFAYIYTFTYLSIGALTPIIGQYLSSIGFSGAQTGTITAAGTTVAIFASAFWGQQYSRRRDKHMMLIMLCLISAAISMVIVNVQTYYLFVMVFGIMYFFQAPIMSLTDALTIESKQNFGVVRSFGAVGFAAGAFISGLIADRCGLVSLFYIYTSAFAVSALSIYLVKGKVSPAKGRAGGEKKKGLRGYLHVLENKTLRQLILCAFFMGGTNVANNTYFGFLYVEGGGTIAGLGAVMLIMVGSEVPFMALCERLSKKFTMERLILAAMIISVARFSLYGLGMPWWMLILLAVSQGAVNGILLVEFVRYAAKLAPEGSESLAISAYYVIGSNLSTICCQLIGGILLDAAGATGVYLFFGFFNLAGVILYIRFKLYIGRTVKPDRIVKPFCE
ncbi:MAG: MFS transporter [Clostridiales bacterium]|nr:MFS transporter [Clostridiales bacterium]